MSYELSVMSYESNPIGKFIVIDGTDGSGKGTQTELLIKRLEQSGYDVKMADFPQYGHKSAGLVEEYLNGKYGSADEVGPYRASMFYAVDRYDASFRIKEWLSEGKIVISNRYVTSNMAHQGGKIKDPVERKKYFKWLTDLEYGIFGIPKPDLNIILHVDAAIAQKLVDHKESRDYINGKKRDIHEADLNHLRNAEQVYLEISRSFPGFKLIECTSNAKILTRGTINEMLWHEVIKIIGPYPHYFYNPNFKSINYPQPPSLYDEVKPKSHLSVQRLNSSAKIPTKAYEDDAGFDLYSTDYYTLLPNERAVIKTGVKIAIPKGCVGLIWDKGGIARDGIHSIAGVIDNGFRGEVTVNLINLSGDIYHIAPGQKIAQLLIQKFENPDIIEEVIDDETDRGDGRFGSSGLF